MLVDAVDKFARRTAEACVSEWDRNTIIERMKLFPDEHEARVVEAIKQIQLEIMRGERE